MPRPMLSIGMIFKNEARCLERCMKSLAPLREAIPCELVMADTGSDDGSREIAEQYADILFDFPWVDDFAAARNAVMDRCSGQWYFSIDADEWLDEDVSALVEFFSPGGGEADADICVITEWNYYWKDFDAGYGVFMPWRLLRLSTGRRFEGAIHETWQVKGLRAAGLNRALLHHDGYVELNGPAGKSKRERNLKPLREELAKDPDNLLVRLQIVESGVTEPDFVDNLRAAVSLVEKRAKYWEQIGPSVMRYAVSNALSRDLPEIEDWICLAEELFPQSYFIRMDAAFHAAVYYWKAEKFEECVRWSGIGLKAHADFRAGSGEIIGQVYGSLQSSTPLCEAGLKIIQARGYFELGRMNEAAALVSSLDNTLLDGLWTRNLLETVQMFHFRSEIKTAPLVSRIWEDICRPIPNEKWANERRASFIQIGTRRFDTALIKSETEDPVFRRHVYTLFLPLAGKCPLGTAAAILEEYDPAELEKLFRLAERWNELPVSALAHAIRQGMAFPMPDRPLRVEEMDDLAARLVREDEALAFSSAEEASAGGWQSVVWSRGLALTAVKHGGWTAAGEEEKGFKLARLFVRTERVFLSRCYTAEMLNDENICTLPAMHRFGWYCVKAFDALDHGDAAGYARHLREGLTSCESMKDMVAFLLEHTPELQKPKPSGELLELAEKVRGMLAAYAPDDPAVMMIKSSPVYQKVATLIEGPGLALVGGLKQ